ncbi:MAG: molybdenum ABC transporter substrate binding component [Candidatus Brocadia fulgida]|uniref:Molybdenum ABC transporter substrate binding component n=1 Tax=Candidatus Brocadia fulgida TaxID=380242 RepID=A0A0M2V0V8_9BACT|nr:MAG: molybdenum ABC transporter substrate binding component [Candidatus Brocadia fulgida]
MRLIIPEKRITRFLAIVCATWLLFLFMAFHHSVRADEKILIAAAANLNPTMDKICKGFEKRYPTIDVDVSYGSSGNFFAQIKQGAPFDIFFSADTTYPARLEEEGLAIKGKSKIYAFGSIVLWIPRKSALNPRKGLQVVLDKEVKKLAIANQKLAPTGWRQRRRFGTMGCGTRFRTNWSSGKIFPRRHNLSSRALPTWELSHCLRQFHQKWKKTEIIGSSLQNRITSWDRPMLSRKEARISRV